MSFIKKYCVILFGFIVSLSNISAEIEMDYFFGETALRSPRSETCEDDDSIVECALCEADKFYRICIFNKCFCLGHEAKKAKRTKIQNLPPSKEKKTLLRNLDDLINVFLRKFKLVEPVEEQRPALRHHIAHFCPNLEMARECIRTCMQVGKPAFCGKDHQCYCGHKYNENSQDEVIDVDDVFAKYRDLYQTYFGTESNNPIIVNGK